MRACLYLKVELDYDPGDTPEKLAEHICRQIQKVYGVRSAELTHFTPEDDL